MMVPNCAHSKTSTKCNLNSIDTELILQLGPLRKELRGVGYSHSDKLELVRVLQKSVYS